jgi:putative ABC transport system substrate-binding protein
MRRRDFITLLGGAAAWPVAARAQQVAMPVIGYLALGTLDTTRENVAEFQRGLSETGFIEGRNVAVEYRWAEFSLERLPALAEDLVRRHVDVIVALTAPAVSAAKAATKSIPIVFQTAVDPVASGLVASFNRPGGNLTGTFIILTDLAPKRLELLHELLPNATSIAFLVSPERNGFNETETIEVQAAARTLGVRLSVLNASDPSEFEAAFAALARERANGLLVSGYQLFGRYASQLVALAARYRVPAMHTTRDAPAAGGLMSYGPSATSFTEVYRLGGSYAGRILKGEKPADLPVQQVTKIDLVINLKTAKALGLTVPLALLTRADEVIE